MALDQINLYHSPQQAVRCSSQKNFEKCSVEPSQSTHSSDPIGGVHREFVVLKEWKTSHDLCALALCYVPSQHLGVLILTRCSLKIVYPLTNLV